MYEGIFEDVERVKAVLASHGHNSVDKTLVFELLEELRVPKQVIKILLGNRVRHNPLANSSDNPWALDRSLTAENTVAIPRPDNSVLSATCEESSSSDDLEVLEHNVSKEARPHRPFVDPVDLTIEEVVKIETKNASQPIIDLTTETQAMEVENSCPTNLVDPKSEDLVSESASDSASESEVEMEDDYYQRRPYIESEDSEGFGESDEKLLSPPSPILAASLVYEDNRGSNLEEAGENRVEEMLEENNNDPNNNLEDIEELEQNNGNSGMMTEKSNVVMEEIARAASPKPGCSKDSYYTDGDFCVDQKAGKIPKVVNGLGIDVCSIRNVLPNLSVELIESTLIKNREALNRVEIALWELLPREKPVPIYPIKRKQYEDGCLSPVKKFASEESSSPEKKCAEASAQGAVAKSEAAATCSKSNIVKPAKLTIPDGKTSMLKPSKLTLPSSKLVLTPPKWKSYDKFPRFDRAMTSDKDAANDTKMARAMQAKLLHKSQPIPSAKPLLIPKPQTDLMSSTVGKEKENLTELEVKKPDRLPKNTQCLENQQDQELRARIERPNTFYANSARSIESIPNGPIPSEVGQTWMDSNPNQSTGVIEKKLTMAWKRPLVEQASASHQRLEKQANHLINHPEYRSKDFRETVNQTVFRVYSPIASGSRPRETVNQPVFKVFNPAASGSRARSDSPILQKSKLTVDFEAPVAVPAIVQAYDPEYLRPLPEQYPYPMSWAGGASVPNAGPAPIQQRKVMPWSCFQSYRNSPIWFDSVPGPRDDIIGGFLEQGDQMQLFPNQKIGATAVDNANNAIRVKKDLEQLQPQEIGDVQALEMVKPPQPQAIGDVQALEMVKPPQTPIADGPPPKELFNPLINMFPDVDPTYITGLCVKAKTQNQALESLVEILLIEGTAHPRIFDPEPEPAELNVDTQYENLQGIFPDAHPQYLRRMAEQYYRDPEAMKNFVQAQLEKPDYPTMADYLKKIKITEQIQQYTDGFSAQKFLEIFPDPFTHFENPKRVHHFNVIAFEFLKFHFKMNKVTTVQKAYKSPQHPHHLSLAAKCLEFIGPDMKGRRMGKMPPTEDIPLLQEFAFIRHKAAIKEYIRTQKQQEKKEFKRLKDNNELLECQCCYDGECMPSKCLTCTEGHIFCKSCIKTGSATKIGEGQTQFPCFVECKGEFALPVLQKVLDPTMFSILLKKRQEEEVKAAGLEGLVSCPFCHFASIPPPEDKVFKCLNPECMKETCRLCKELNHVPLKCDEVIKGEDARHYLEEKMTEALVRKCYKCARPFFKVEGCNKMTCPCGATTCYICGEPVRGYEHFNGQGSDRIDLCPLWSDNQMLNAQSVRAVAEAAQKEILKKNPNLKIDATALMPSLPQASRGPHQDIANAHVLPVHARRV